jgi:hypothetical protein
VCSIVCFADLLAFSSAFSATSSERIAPANFQIVEKNRRAKFNRAYTQRFFQITAVFAIATIASSEFLSPAQVRLDLGFFGAAKARKRLRTPTPLRLIHLTPQPNRSFWTKRPTLPASACSLFSCPVYLPP